MDIDSYVVNMHSTDMRLLSNYLKISFKNILEVFHMHFNFHKIMSNSFVHSPLKNAV